MARELLVAIAGLLLVATAARADAPLPETRLPLRLVGTVVATNEARSIAVIESGAQISVLSAGDEVGGARVQEIRRDAVVLSLSGRLERLALGGASAATGSQAGARGGSVASAAGQADASEGRDPGYEAARPSARARARAAARASRPSALPANAAADAASAAGSAAAMSSEQMLATLASQARYAPLLDDAGKLRGVALMDVRPDSTLERVGLRSGDVVVSIAGVRVDNTTAAFDALRALDPSAGGEVIVERQGVPTSISVPPGTL